MSANTLVPVKPLRATHGTPDDTGVHIGQMDIPCYVLEDGTRVLTGRGMQRALVLGNSHGSQLASFMGTKSIKSFIPNDLAMDLENPIRFIRPGRGGKIAAGYEATVLPRICDVVLEARKQGALTTDRQMLIADQCEMLTRALAKVGIIALIDEATGYQEVRERHALQKILDKYLLADYQKKWSKRFPNEFYQELFRIKGWTWVEGSSKRPGVVAAYTNDLIYERLAPGVLEEIKRRNKEVEEETGKKPYQHSWLTLDTGIPALDIHFIKLLTIMNLTPNSNWNYLKRMVARAMPKANEQLQMEVE